MVYPSAAHDVTAKPLCARSINQFGERMAKDAPSRECDRDLSGTFGGALEQGIRTEPARIGLLRVAVLHLRRGNKFGKRFMRGGNEWL